MKRKIAVVVHVDVPDDENIHATIADLESAAMTDALIKAGFNVTGISRLSPSALSLEVIDRREPTMKGGATTIFLRLPEELQRPIDRCECETCKAGAQPFWDALAIRATQPPKDQNDFSYTVHMPPGRGY